MNKTIQQNIETKKKWKFDRNSYTHNNDTQKKIFLNVRFNC